MRKFSSIICAAGLSAFAAPVAAVTIDFEEFAATTVIQAGTEYRGITFDQNIQIGAFGFLDGPATDGFIARGTQPLGGTVRGVFNGTVDMLTLGAGDVCCDVDTVTLSGFDAWGSLIDSATFSNSASQFLSISGTGISSFILAQSSGGFDNFTFNLNTPSVVPLPATLPLMLAALGGLGLYRRRKS